MNALKSTIVVGLCLLPVSGLTANSDKPVIVLDASNSMWGQIEGRHKIEFARDTLTNLLKTKPEQAANITLITYGSQRKGDCNDIKTVPAGNPETLLQQVEGITPKGRSPISAAITQAVAASHRILLISDGQESCDADPCATARQLKATYPDLQIHVLGFRDTPKSQLHCIADNTGGTFTLASSPDALASLQRSASQMPADAESTPASVPDPPGRLELTLGAGDDPANLAGSFLLYDQNDEHINSFTARQEVSQTLPAGKYRVDVLWKQMKLSESLTVSPNQTTRYRFNIGGMGQLKLESMDSQHQPASANFTIYTQDGDYLSDFLLKSGIDEQLPSGIYHVRAELAGQSLEADIEITAGKESHHTFVFGPANPK